MPLKKRLIKTQKSLSNVIKLAKTDISKMQEPVVQMRKPILGKRRFSD
jgi:hypothetical protein